MPSIHTGLRPLLRESPSQGVIESFLVVLTFSISLYLQTGDSSNVLRCICSFLLVLLNLYESDKYPIELVQKVYWVALIPVLYAIGAAWSPLTLYTSMQVHLYFRMMGGMSKTFTAGELFLTTHVLVTIFEYSLNAQDLTMTIILFPIKLTVGFTLLYAVVSKIAGRGNYSTIYFSLVSFTFTFVVTAGILIYQGYNNYDKLPEIYERLFKLLFGTKHKILLITYWAFLIITSVASFYGLKHNLKLGLISSRKLFHVLTLVLFLPGFIYSPDLMLFAFNVALVLFLLLEFMRLRLSQSFKFLHAIGLYFNQYYSCFTQNEQCGIIGSTYGVNKWPRSKKTYLGTFGGFVFTMICNIMVMQLLLSWKSVNLVVNSMIATMGMIALEGYTDQNDNLHVPTFYLALYLILDKVNPVY